MNNGRKTLALLAVLGIVGISGCSSASAEKPRQTFRTVKTVGIEAYTEKSRAAQTAEMTEMTESAPETTVSKITHHYETTIPETLVGSLPEPTAVEASESTEPPPTAAPAQTEKETATAAETTERSKEPSYGYEKLGESGILVVRRADGHYWGLMPCWGTYSLCESWAESVNELKRRLPDVNVYQTVIPTSSEFYVPARVEGFTASQKNKIDHVTERLENVTNIDAYSAVSAHADEAVYARTDHHWLPLGAYYAAEEFAKTAELPFPPLSDYARVEAGGYVGSLYAYSKDEHLKNDPETFTLYLPPNGEALTTFYYDKSFQNGYESSLMTAPDGSAYYCSFLGSDDRIAKIETDCPNGRTLVLFKESYGNALVPFLTSSFGAIYVCDIRYFDLNAVEFCKNVGATDVLMAVCTYTAAGTNGNYLSKILN